MSEVKHQAYYNEIDPVAAQWLRNLIDAGHIAPGIVDERSIEDVTPNDLRGFTQVHLFAGIGTWSYALRRAGWRDDRRVWTASCPCQPFSAAGKSGGFDDERHLWPSVDWLVRQCRPTTLYGEQVASKAAEPWIDLVQADLEALGYAFGCVAFPAAGVGAPHIRDRTYWVAHAAGTGLQERERYVRVPCGESGTFTWEDIERGSVREAGGLADAQSQRRQDGEKVNRGGSQVHGTTAEIQRARDRGSPGGSLCGTGGLEDSNVSIAEQLARQRPRPSQAYSPGPHGELDGRSELAETEPSPGPVNGHWRTADWLHCRDGKWRPACPRPQPMVDGSAESLGRVHPEVIETFKEDLNAWSVETKSNVAEGVRTLLENLGTESHACWALGRLPRLHEAPFLLAFMRQLTEQGWKIPQGVALSCSEKENKNLQRMRFLEEITGTSRERELDGQLSVEFADSLHLLSHVLARAASSAWTDAYSTYAEIGFPLHVGARSRVPRLRAYGNGIVAEAAEEFIRASMT